MQERPVPWHPPLFLLGKEEPHHGDLQPQPGCSPLPSAEAHSGKRVTQANPLPVRMCWASRVAVVAQEGTPSCPEVFRPESEPAGQGVGDPSLEALPESASTDACSSRFPLTAPFKAVGQLALLPFPTLPGNHPQPAWLEDGN